MDRYSAQIQHALATSPSAQTEPLVAIAAGRPVPSHVSANATSERPVHRPLRAYAAARAASIAPEVGTTLDCSSFETLKAETTLPAEAQGILPAAAGTRICTAAWSAVALHAAGYLFSDLPWTARAARIMDQVVAAQRPDGSFFTPARTDSPETLWYHELVLLHAVTSYGLLTDDPSFIERASAAALYHLHETQPDHATTQPWALNAFLLSPDTSPLADQLLHTLQTQHPAGPDPISSILLADTLLTLPSRP